MICEVFISHADADKVIAAEFTRLLATGLDITGKNVFCSSLPGRTIPGGFNFVKHIGDALKNSKIIILILTENYLVSQFCLAELGASWISKEHIVPIVVPPLGFDKLKATLAIKQAWKINDDDGLNAIADDICDSLKLKVNNAQWGFEKKGFIEKVEALIKDQTLPEIISPDDYKKSQDEVKYCTEKIADLNNKIIDKDKLVHDLEKLKDKSEVADLKVKSMDEFEQFESLCDNVKTYLYRLPSIVQEALYYDYKEESLPIPNVFDDEKWERINDAVDNDFLETPEDEPIGVLSSHPKIKKTYKALNELNDFMNQQDQQMHELIEEKYDITFNINNKSFWEEFLGL